MSAEDIRNMFNLDPGKLLIIGVVAILLLGPADRVAPGGPTGRRRLAHVQRLSSQDGNGSARQHSGPPLHLRHQSDGSIPLCPAEPSGWHVDRGCRAGDIARIKPTSTFRLQFPRSLSLSWLTSPRHSPRATPI